MTAQLHVTPICKHHIDVCAVFGVKSIQEPCVTMNRIH